MDPFAAIMLGLVGGLLIFLLLIGKYYPGSGADVVDWKPTRSAETEIQNEIDDLDQMLEAANRRRRAKGRPELTEDTVRSGLNPGVREQVKRRDAYLADLEVVQMLAAKNERRRAKGLPEITEAEYRAKLAGELRRQLTAHGVRALVVGGGARALALTRSLSAEGHAVRVVTRDPERRRAAIEGAGGECWPGDPDRIGTLRYALENVTILLWLLASATGEDDERVAALHGSRLRMMLEKVTDSTVRGVIYETVGTLPADVIAAGIEEVRHAGRTNEIPFALLDADPAGEDAWVSAVRAEIDTLLATNR